MRTELRPNEVLIFEVKQHGIILLRPILYFLLSTLPVTSAFYFGLQWASYLSVLPLLMLFWFGWKVMDWKTNLWAVTSMRVIDEYGVISNNTKESPLDKINNIAYQQTILGRLFNYGDVQIQTAAEMGDCTYLFVASPKKLKDTIFQCQEKYKQIQLAAQAQEFAKVLSSQQASGESDIIECPFCAERIKAKAKICRFCNRDIPLA